MDTWTAAFSGFKTNILYEGALGAIKNSTQCFVHLYKVF